MYIQGHLDILLYCLVDIGQPELSIYHPHAHGGLF